MLSCDFDGPFSVLQIFVCDGLVVGVDHGQTDCAAECKAVRSGANIADRVSISAENFSVIQQWFWVFNEDLGEAFCGGSVGFLCE